MMKGKVVCAFGISDAGKIRMISDFVSSNRSFIYLQAGELMQAERSMREVTKEAYRTATTQEIVANQNLLAKAFIRVRRAWRKSTFYLMYIT